MTMMTGRRGVLTRTASLGLAALGCVTLADTAVAGNTIEVTNYSQLVAAIADAAPGDEIVLANGTYRGEQVVVAANGTAQQPIVIRAAVLLAATVPHGFELSGSHIVLSGLNFESPSAPLVLRLGGNNNQVWRCRFATLGGIHIQPIDGFAGKVMYCEFTSLAPDDHYQPHLKCLIGHNRSGEDHRHLEIGYCYLHDLPSKPAGEAYGFRQRGGILIGSNYHYMFRETNWYVHHCLLENTGSCRLAIYSSNNRVEHCIIVGRSISDSPASSDFNQRFGRQNTWLGCWGEGTRGAFQINSSDQNKWIGCKSVGSASSSLFMGNQETDVIGPGYNRPAFAKFTACEFPLTVGRRWTTSPEMTLPPYGTRIEGHIGTVDLADGNHIDTVLTDELTEASASPRRLNPGMVGPYAGP